jgi:glutamate 5-kinase
MNTWARAFAPTPVAQFLLSKYDLTNPVSFINARRALRALAERDVIPIGNENDTVATDEIKIGDNDTLGAAVAKIRGADLLVILTQVDGLYNGNPEEDSSAELIHTVLPEEIAHAESVAGDASSDGLGTGGFATKLQAVKLAYSAGIPVVIANGYTRNILNRVLSGEQIGTLFVPPEGTGGTQWLNNHWPVKGRLEVSEKAAERLCDRNTEHLWMEDVARVLGDFHRGDCVALGCNGKLLGRGLVGYDTEVIAQLKGLGSEKVLQSLGPKRYDFQVMDRADLVIYSEPH